MKNNKTTVYGLVLKSKRAMTPLIKLAGFLTVVLLCITSCDDFVQIEIPQNQLVAEGVFEESTTATAAMTAIYSKLRDAGVLSGSATGVSNLMGQYADELNFYGSSQSQVQPFFKNTVLPTQSSIQNLWNDSYKQIYSANSVIEGVTKAEALPEGDRKQLKGEALFVRALVHFYLANLYGPVPYVTTTDYEVNKKVGKKNVATVYQEAVIDLDNAIPLLNETYLNDGRSRPNKFTAMALLARIKLYSGLYNEAANAASAVLNESGLYPLETNLNTIFLNSSSNTIWQLPAKNAGGNTLEGNTFIFQSVPPPQGALSESLLAAFEPEDLRKTLWTQTISGSAGSWSHAFKYKQRGNTASSVESSIVFRTDELYLIRAEARAQSGELTSAKDDLNIIRNRSGLAPTTAVTKEQILDAILKERRVELFTEFGHRFFDLKRTGMIDTMLSATKEGWDSTESLLPLPQVELDLNPALLPQNSGY